MQKRLSGNGVLAEKFGMAVNCDVSAWSSHGEPILMDVMNDRDLYL